MTVPPTTLRLPLLTISLAITGLLLEVVLQIYYYRWNSGLSVPFLLFYRSYPESEELGNFIQASPQKGILFELKPNIRSNFLRHHFITNSKGMLGAKEFSYKKPVNTLRIIGIGDSVMSSWGIDPDKTYLRLLNEKLTRAFPHKNTEVLNFAVPGYNTAIEYEIIKTKAIQYNPDLIIIGFVGNDMDLPNYIRKKVLAKSYLYYFLSTTFQHIKAFLKYPGFHRDNALTDAPSVDEFRFVYQQDETPPEYQYMVGYDNYIKTMKNIAKITIEQGIPVVLILEKGDHSEKTVALQAVGYHVFDVAQAIDEYVKSNNLTASELKIGNGDTHYNEFGHEILAKLLYEYLTNDAEVNLLYNNLYESGFSN